VFQIDGRTQAIIDQRMRDYAPAVREQVLARTQERSDAGLYDSECDLFPVTEALPPAAEALARALSRLEEPARALRDRLAARLEQEAEELETGDRIRIEAACRAIERRALIPIQAWQGMLATIQADPPEPGARPAFVDWLSLERRGGTDTDAGMHRHHIDPTEPFARAVAAPAHGLLITSASHMPRSMGVFRQAGWSNIIAWPVNYRTGHGFAALYDAPFPERLGQFEWGFREWLGLVAYRLMGRTDALLPAP
jgi:ATP-dependent DNA helicase DinG